MAARSPIRRLRGTGLGAEIINTQERNPTNNAMLLGHCHTWTIGSNDLEVVQSDMLCIGLADEAA